MTLRPAPFAVDRLESLMDEAGIDVLLATSRANVLYLTGGHYHHPFSRSADHGDTHYLPVVGVPRAGDPFVVAGPNEGPELAARESWIAEVRHSRLGVNAAATTAAQVLADRGLTTAVIGVEASQLPMAAADGIRAQLPDAVLVDALPVLLELRAVKRPEEQAQMRKAAEITAAAIDAALEGGPESLSAVAAAVAAETEARGGAYVFSYTSAGSDRHRFPRPSPWAKGELLQVDSGCDVDGYRSDVCRMACRGNPVGDALALYDACVEVHQLIAAEIRPGRLGRDVLDSAHAALLRPRRPEPGRIVIHGMGLGHHELPDLAKNPARPLEEGNVLSVEVEFAHPELGLVKVEDALAVTASGSLLLGVPFGGLRIVA